MVIEHIAAGRFILDLTQPEIDQLKLIAVGFYKSNRSNCLRKLIEAGLTVYNELLQQGYDHDNQFKDSLKVVCDNLVGDSIEFGEHDDGFHNDNSKN